MSKKGYTQTKEHIRKRIEKTTGKKRTKEFKKRTKNIMTKFYKTNEGKKIKKMVSKKLKGSHVSPRTEFKKGLIPWNKGLKGFMAGEKNPNWKGGVSKINNILRHSLEYKLWREAVFKRDNYNCIWCGQVGGKLVADHIKPFALFPELRFAIDNGRTLCKNCHKKTDTYGWKLINKRRNKKC